MKTVLLIPRQEIWGREILRRVELVVEDGETYGSLKKRLEKEMGEGWTVVWLRCCDAHHGDFDWDMAYDPRYRHLDYCVRKEGVSLITYDHHNTCSHCADYSDGLVCKPRK